MKRTNPSQENIYGRGLFKPRWLFLSLALNLFLVGVVLAPFLAPRGAPPFGAAPMPPRPPGMMLERVEKGLSLAEGAKLRAILEDERKTAQNRHDVLHTQQEKLVQILREEKPDLAALHKVLDDLRRMGQSLHEGMGRMMERIATELSFESRRKIADALERERPPGPPPGDALPPPEPF